MEKRKERSPEEQERRAKIGELMQLSGVSSMDDIQELFKETIAEFMEDSLEAELREELGYSKYDYKHKETENSRNGHSSKKLRTSYGEVEISIPRDRKGEFEPQLQKKNQTSIRQDIEEKILSMYAKGMSTWDIEVHIRDIYGLSELYGHATRPGEGTHKSPQGGQGGSTALGCSSRCGRAVIGREWPGKNPPPSFRFSEPFGHFQLAA